MLLETLVKYSSLFFHKIDKTDIRLFLESSPQYPNLLSVVQTLRYLGMDVQVGQCDWGYLKNLVSPFLLHLKVGVQETLIISKWDTKTNSLKVLNTSNSSWKVRDKKAFDGAWDGVVIYTDANTINYSYSKDKIALSLLVIIIVLFTSMVLKQKDISFINILPIVIGLIVSLCAYWRKYISEINIVERICHKSSISDCDAVESSFHGTWKGVNMSAMALSFFSSQFICMFLFSILELSNALYSIYFISAIVLIPIASYSIYGQIRIGKICPLCLMILACVFAESFIVIFMPTRFVKLEALIVWGILNICMLILLCFYSQSYQNQQKHLKDKIQLLTLKRKKEIVLLESSHITPIITPIWFGKEKASINITTIISPSCNHCRKVVFDFFSLIEKGVEFQWSIVLGKTMNEDSKKIEIWVQEYMADKNKFLQNLYLWSRGNRLVQSLNSIPSSAVQDTTVFEICSGFDKQIESLNILGFPQIILNGRLLSNMYTVKDLEYVIRDSIFADPSYID